jgi:hypothetical protein
MNPPIVEYKRRIIIWTPELDAYVEYWLDRRKSYKWISLQLNISRNAIIGRVSRNIIALRSRK